MIGKHVIIGDVTKFNHAFSSVLFARHSLRSQTSVTTYPCIYYMVTLYIAYLLYDWYCYLLFSAYASWQRLRSCTLMGTILHGFLRGMYDSTIHIEYIQYVLLSSQFHFLFHIWLLIYYTIITCSLYIKL